MAGGPNAIVGRVLNPSGKPVPGDVRHRAHSRAAGSSAFRFVSARLQSITNERGEFRLARVVLGEFYVVALPRNQPLDVGQRPNRVGYTNTFHPNAVRVADAKRIRVTPSGPPSADIVLTPARLSVISGLVTGSTGQPVSGGTLVHDAWRRVLRPQYAHAGHPTRRHVRGPGPAARNLSLAVSRERLACPHAARFRRFRGPRWSSETPTSGTWRSTPIFHGAQGRPVDRRSGRPRRIEPVVDPNRRCPPSTSTATQVPSGQVRSRTTSLSSSRRGRRSVESASPFRHANGL